MTLSYTGVGSKSGEVVVRRVRNSNEMEPTLFLSFFLYLRFMNCSKLIIRQKI